MSQKVDHCLEHLDRMTDSTGLIQHAIYGVPRRESGYCTDDNARALRLCTRLWQQKASTSMLNRVSTYMSFVEHAQCSRRGFHNFMGYDRNWLDAEGCGDCQGQAVLALAEVLGSDLPEGYRLLARELINAVLPALADLRSLRAQAYIIIAWGHLRAAGVKEIEPLESVAWSAANRLAECYERASRSDWFWFESRMTYANAVLPHSLMIAAQRWPQEKFRDVATASFAFLEQVTTVNDYFQPIGNDGWYEYGEEKACYDQQPVEAATMAEASLAAYELTGNSQHLTTLARTRDWFFGENSLRLSLLDSTSCSCFDGLTAKGVNRNQGAESTLAYLLVAILDSASEVVPSRKRRLKA
jgi:hypothetical protein